MRDTFFGIKLSRIWLVFTTVWMTCVPFFVSKHYEPVQNEYHYIYNAFVSSKHLLKSNKQTRYQLQAYFTIDTGYNIYSIIVPSKVQIAFPAYYNNYGKKYTWIPDSQSIKPIYTESDQWKSFRKNLINEALKMREQSIQSTLRQYLLWDVWTIIGPPLFLLLMWVLWKDIDFK
jgi:hypothetical protein